MKKAFTLIEMLVVLIIIGILLGIMSIFSWSYINKLNVENELETIENYFFGTQVSSMSQPSLGKVKDASYVGVKLFPNKDYIEKVALTGTLQNINPIVIGISNFSYIKIGTGFEIYSGSSLEKNTTNNMIFLYKPYTIGAYAIEEDGSNYNIFSGDYTIKFYTESIYHTKKCFSINLVSGRLEKQECN